MFDCWVTLVVVDERWRNAQPAPLISPKAVFTPIGVIARFVSKQGVECWVPGTAVRWTQSVVLVGVGGTFDKTYTWLPAADVTRVIPAEGGRASW